MYLNRKTGWFRICWKLIQNWWWKTKLNQLFYFIFCYFFIQINILQSIKTQCQATKVYYIKFIYKLFNHLLVAIDFFLSYKIYNKMNIKSHLFKDLVLIYYLIYYATFKIFILNYRSIIQLKQTNELHIFQLKQTI